MEHTDLRLRIEQELVSHGRASYHLRKEQGGKDRVVEHSGILMLKDQA